MKNNYNIYEYMANNIKCDTQIAGRYSIQKKDEKRIVPDLLKKLDIQSSDSLLEIGCGTGNLLIPLSFYVDKAVGLDNKNAIKKLLNRVNNADNLTGYIGDFLTYDISTMEKFKKILIYSVLHCLDDKKTVYSFIDRALNLLDKDGILLLGDIPNTSLKANFLKSNSGKEFNKQWAERMKKDTTQPFEASIPSYIFDDSNIFDMMQHIKAKGYKAYILSQPSNLPFGHTREDIVVSGF